MLLSLSYSFRLMDAPDVTPRKGFRTHMRESCTNVVSCEFLKNNEIETLTATVDISGETPTQQNLTNWEAICYPSRRTTQSKTINVPGCIRGIDLNNVACLRTQEIRIMYPHYDIGDYRLVSDTHWQSYGSSMHCFACSRKCTCKFTLMSENQCKAQRWAMSFTRRDYRRCHKQMKDVFVATTSHWLWYLQFLDWFFHLDGPAHGVTMALASGWTVQTTDEDWTFELCRGNNRCFAGNREIPPPPKLAAGWCSLIAPNQCSSGSLLHLCGQDEWKPQETRFPVWVARAGIHRDLRNLKSSRSWNSSSVQLSHWDWKDHPPIGMRNLSFPVCNPQLLNLHE